MPIERRFFRMSQVRSSRGGKGILGYAAVYDQLSDDLGGFREKILRGAFTRCLASDPDVRCLFNHNPELILGRTKSGTLDLSEDPNGLFFDCELPETSVGRDLRESVSRGDVDQCSFSFQVEGQNWREEKTPDGDVRTIRELTDVDLFDVGPVTFAAYPQTSVSARGAVDAKMLFPEGIPSEVRARKFTSRAGVIPAQAPSTPRATSANLKTDAERLAHVQRKLGVSTHGRNLMRKPLPLSKLETLELRRFMLTGSHEQRDLTTGGPAAAFVPMTWNEHVFEAMRAYDAIFNDDFCTIIKTDTGAPCKLFALDDTETSAVIVGEGAPSNEVDPLLFDVLLPQAPIWDSQTVAISYALLQDSAVDLPAMLAKALGIRLARGISASLIPVLLAAADLGATATGDLNGSGATAANSIGYQDLIALRKSVDPAYRASGKASWLMNDDTLSALDSLCDKNGRPIIRPVYLNGQRLLLGYPVGICPSLPDIGAGATPIVFGATGYFAVRTVKDRGDEETGRLIRITEAEGYVENLLVGFKTFLRANGALLCARRPARWRPIRL